MLIWDDEVDVVCVGGGVAALAAAIAAVELGGEVYVAGPAHPPADGPLPETLTDIWLGPDVTDAETIRYLRALSADLTSVTLARDAVIPVREVVPPPPFDPRGQVEPFIGSRLRDWAGQCLSSPYGLLHTRVSDRGMDTLHTPQAEIIEVKVVGSWPAGPPPSGAGVAGWLAAQAEDREIDVHRDDRLERVVCEEGEVVGVVLTTGRGPRAVRRRHGATLTPAVPAGDTPAELGLPHYQHEIRIGLVSQTASRFGRLEVLTRAGGLPLRGHVADRRNPGPADRRAQDRRMATVTDLSRRRRKPHRYPPAGE